MHPISSTIKNSWLHPGKVAKPLVSPLTPVPYIWGKRGKKMLRGLLSKFISSSAEPKYGRKGTESQCISKQTPPVLPQ